MEAEIRPYSPIDAFLFDFSEEEEIKATLRENIHHFLQLPNAFTVIFNGKMVAIFYYHKLMFNVAEICMYTSTYFFKMPVKEVIKTTAKILNTMSNKFRRLQAVVRSSLTKNQRYLKYFGFNQEGIMQSFGYNKEDYFLYARINRTRVF